MNEINTRFLILNSVVFPVMIGTFFFENIGVLSKESVFWGLHALFGIYVFMSLYEVCRQEKNGIFSYSAILMLFQFVGQVFIGNFVYLIDGVEHNDWDYMNKAMMLCFLAVFALTLSCYISSFAWAGRKLSKYFFRDIAVECLYTWRCVLLFVCSFSLVVFMTLTGMSGYTDAASLERAASYTGIIQYLNYLAGGSGLVLYLLFYVYLRQPSELKRNIFLLLLALTLIVAITSGMKRDVIGTFVYLFMIYYLVRQKINVWLILLLLVAVAGLYQFIDAYRVALRLDTFNGDRLEAFFSVINGLGSAQGLYSNRLGLDEIVEAFFSRLSITGALSLVVEYNDVVGLGPDDPTFLQDWLVTPFTIFLPRVLFPFKSMTTYGLWVTHTVMEMPEAVNSSSYITVEGFLYLAGGIIMVPVGFFIIGAVLNFFGAFCRIEEKNPIFVIVFILVAIRLMEPSSPVDIVTDVVRTSIIYTLMGMWLIRRRRKGTGL